VCNFRRTHQISLASREIVYALFDANSDRQAASHGVANTTEVGPASRLASTQTQVAPDVELARCFLRLCNLANYALDRLSRYEASLWRSRPPEGILRRPIGDAGADYETNLQFALSLQLSALRFFLKVGEPRGRGIIQHNLGLLY
jgi:hypothetical protein